MWLIYTIYRYLDQLQEKGWVRFSRTAGLDSVLVEKVDEWKLIEATYQGMGKGVNAVEA